MPTTCPKCHAACPPEAKFCLACGASLRDAQPTATVDTSRNVLRGRGPIADVPEVTLWEGRYAPQAMYGEFLLAAIFTLVGLVLCALFAEAGWIWGGFLIVAAVIWIYLGGLFWYRRNLVHFKLTNLRFFKEMGLLSKTVDHMEVLAMNDFETRQGFIERIFGVGDLLIISSDNTQSRMWLKGIPKVRETADVFDKARRAERQRRGNYLFGEGTVPVTEG